MKRTTLFWISVAKYGTSQVTKEGLNDQSEIGMSCVWPRVVLDLFVNFSAEHGILFFVPIQVATGSKTQLDFVLNVVAAFFVIEMDDLSEGVRFIVSTPGERSTHNSKKEERRQEEAEAKK
jgi:hypothetical protein